MKTHSMLAAATLLGALLAPLSAAAQGELVVYCTVQEEWCRPMVAAFEKSTGIKVSMTRKSSGEFYAQLKAEAANPRGDIWWGGTGDPHMQAAEEGLTEPYKSPKLAELQDWAVRQAEQSKYRTVGIYAGALGYSYNTDELKKRGLPEPKCWADLTTPAFKDEVQVANPNSSGTSYTMLATLVQIMGEAKAFDYLKALHKNVNQYTKSGAAPARAAATGESLVGITFQHDAVIQALGGAPVKIVSPCEGTGYEIGSMSIVKGAKNMANAKLWYDWALSVEGQAIGAANKVSYQVPSNKAAPVPAAAPKLADIKLINYDFAKYGSSAERKRLLGKWDAEVSTLPK
ncbi:extracellular solute-binding protein family 1 [Leptothrix cholodnii SP-6]|uniref:Extracellular solute-binding protein family 1 n=1 Tax=Leptothrix cholodnii (strain ATCC 51168 / LMG 8142 / SP-6) TaxID=395495 RepID=B1XZK5_LEPCP|nr:ABC transporter substrate-binding protein [Leptothrix cholodnii]ACB36568.1 extracellular solute-binding protein family 1 [Leptothrix cholodnii SP-6]